MADAIEHSVLSPDLKLKQKILNKYVLPWTIMFQQVCLLIRKTLQPFFYQFYLIKFKNNSQQREITDHNDKQINETKNEKLTTPSGSISSRCFLLLSCIPDKTNCPGVVVDSRTKKSPSLCNNRSASALLIGPWNHISFLNCSMLFTLVLPETSTDVDCCKNGSVTKY